MKLTFLICALLSPLVGFAADSSEKKEGTTIIRPFVLPPIHFTIPSESYIQTRVTYYNAGKVYADLMGDADTPENRLQNQLKYKAFCYLETNYSHAFKEGDNSIDATPISHNITVKTGWSYINQHSSLAPILNFEFGNPLEFENQSLPSAQSQLDDDTPVGAILPSKINGALGQASLVFIHCKKETPTPATESHHLVEWMIHNQL